MAKARMTDRERVEALLRREKPDRVPHWPLALGFTTVYAGSTIADNYNNPKVAIAAQRKTAEDFDWVFLPWPAAPTLLAWEFGGEIKWPEGELSQAPSITRWPVSKPEEVFELELPDPKTAGYFPLMMEFCKLGQQERLDNEPFNVVCFPGTGPFTGTANIPGVDNFTKWMYKAPKAVKHLLRLGTDFYISVAELWKETFGTEGVLPMMGEPTPSNALISPKQFEEFALPQLKEVADGLLGMGFKHIWVHICGDHNLNLPHWAKINFGDPGIISTPHEIPVEKMAEYFPNDIIFGNLEPAIVQIRTPDEVYEATREIVEAGKRLKQGFIFSQGCELPPMSPIENVKAMCQAVEDYGYYD
jgi:uroporphyrinogen decarboxylase